MAGLLPWLVACDDDAPAAGTDDPGAASDANGYASCAMADRVGGFEVLVHGELISIGGRVASGVVPADVLETELAERGCELLRPPRLVCEPDCASGTTCDGARCIEFPVGQDVGSVAIEGLGAHVEMAPRGAGNFYFWGDPIARPPFEPGSPVTLHASGGVTEAFSLHARGVPLLETAEVTPLRRERIAIVRWGPAAAMPGARVRLVLNIANHGGTPARIECEVEDSGRFALPLELKDRLLSLGHSGFPTLDVVRQSAGAALGGLGCVDLVVASRITVPVEIPGLISCSTDADCPTGESCRSDLRCDGVTRDVEDVDPSPGASDAGTGDASAPDVSAAGDGDGVPVGDGELSVGDGGLADAGVTSDGGGTSDDGGTSTPPPIEPDPVYGAPPVLLPLDDWCGGQHASFSFFVTSMDALWTLAGSSPGDDAGGFGGNLGGLSGADAICQAIGEATGSGRTWRAFLSAADDGFGQPVHAIDRIGPGPWYDAEGRLVAMDVAGLLSTRPQGDVDAVVNLLDECGVPLTVHGNAHDTLTGSDVLGMAPADWALHATCWNWTTSDPAIGMSTLLIGHAYPRYFDDLSWGAEWIHEHAGRGCGKGRLLDDLGNGQGTCVGCTGGYGAIYCFAE